MDIQSVNRAIRRARKTFAHATRALEGAESETARRRHARRAHHAARRMKEAEREFSILAMTDA